MSEVKYQCPLFPDCRKEYRFEVDNPIMVESILKQHVTEHNAEDFLKTIARLRKEKKLALEILEEVQTLFLTFQKIGDRLGIFNRNAHRHD